MFSTVAFEKRDPDLVGLIRVREHCLFRWRRPADGVHIAEVDASHCKRCVDELRAMGWIVQPG
jgi:hypothetical protein